MTGTGDKSYLHSSEPGRLMIVTLMIGNLSRSKRGERCSPAKRGFAISTCFLGDSFLCSIVLTIAHLAL